MKGKLTITRRTSNRREDDVISIKVEDELSGVLILEVEVELKEYAYALSGLSAQECNITFKPSHTIVDTIGKKREVIDYKIPKVIFENGSYDKDIQKRTLLKYLENDKSKPPESEGWKLYSDGLSSQQPSSEFHRLVFIRFV